MGTEAQYPFTFVDLTKCGEIIRVVDNDKTIRNSQNSVPCLWGKSMIKPIERMIVNLNIAGLRSGAHPDKFQR